MNSGISLAKTCKKHSIKVTFGDRAECLKYSEKVSLLPTPVRWFTMTQTNEVADTKPKTLKMGVTKTPGFPLPTVKKWLDGLEREMRYSIRVALPALNVLQDAVNLTSPLLMALVHTVKLLNFLGEDLIIPIVTKGPSGILNFPRGTLAADLHACLAIYLSEEIKLASLLTE